MGISDETRRQSSLGHDYESFLPARRIENIAPAESREQFAVGDAQILLRNA